LTSTGLSPGVRGWEPERMAIKIRPYKRGGFEVDIRLRLPDGTLHRERVKSPVSSRSGTQRWAQDRERHLLTHGVPPKTPKQPEKIPVPTVKDMAQVMLTEAKSHRRKPSTIRQFELVLNRHLVPKFGDLPIDKLDHTHVDRLREAGAKSNARTVNRHVSTLVRLQRLAMERGVEVAKPLQVRLLKTHDKEARWWEPDELDRLVEAAKTSGTDALAVILLGAHAGLRRGELAGLEWSDVDFRRDLLRVTRNVWRGEVLTPKGNRTRTVPLTPQLREALQAHRHLVGPRVLYRADGTEVTESSLRWLITQVELAAGLTHKGPHALRHTFCSHLAIRAVPARVIQELAGHTSIVTTQRYMHLAPGALHSAIALLGNRGDIVEAGLRETKSQ
jgi:integrase